MSLHITYILSKQSDQAKLFSPYKNCLNKMSNSNKISTKFDTEITENEEYLKIKFDKFKAEASSSIYIEMFSLN